MAWVRACGPFLLAQHMCVLCARFYNIHVQHKDAYIIEPRSGKTWFYACRTAAVDMNFKSPICTLLR
ncbi:hypothetical protein DPMN_160451 [Dreissena polymorpha]|uniref:Secreted protein n=1 Tax=Dreissena polymorpha TaxID=45954 RepID=A0A9D4EN67_DREPO|nr:hypothetical protein DPMN_160451 [Dreissena polymorpha]